MTTPPLTTPTRRRTLAAAGRSWAHALTRGFTPPDARDSEIAPKVAAAARAKVNAAGRAARPARRSARRVNPLRSRGHAGRGGGAWALVPTAPVFRGTSAQVCGLWPFAAGATRPDVGTPVGYDLTTGTTVCCDPFTWFRAGWISAPGMMIFGLNGTGKSTFTTRQILGAIDQGVTVLIAGDLKPDYVHLVAALGGQVSAFGAGQRLNPLDQAAMTQAAARIGGEKGAVLTEWAVRRAATVVAALVAIVRRAPAADWEAGLLTSGIRHLTTAATAAGRPAPTLPELAALLRDPTPAMRTAVLADDDAEYAVLTKALNRSLGALLDGPMGATFAGASTHRFDLDAPAVCVDISAVANQSEDLLAAVMIACWSETFAAVEAANALADAGAGPQRNFLVVMDEMWHPMRIAGAGLVDKLDEITRLNRRDGVGHIFITHTLKDLESLDCAADVHKARGFIERSPIVVTAALAREDLHALSAIRKLSATEIDTVAGWSTPPGWHTRPAGSRDGAGGQADATRRPAAPPGVGKVLIKVGQRPGIATQVMPTDTELALHDTNRRWHDKAAGFPIPRPAPATGPAPAEFAVTQAPR